MIGLDIDTRSFLRALDSFGKGYKERLSQRLARISWIVHERITERTPVWTGETLRNWQWSVGVAPEGVPQPAVGNEPTGRTNDMPLGMEPRRPANQMVADASYNAIDFSNPFQKFIFSNNSPSIEGLEYGLYPLPPLNQRSPQGMVRLTFAEVSEMLESGAI